MAVALLLGGVRFTGGMEVNMKIILSLALLFLVTGSLVLAQKDEDATRKLWDTAFISSSSAKKARSHRRSQRRYRVATPNVPIDNVAPDSVVGVTIWRLRPATRSDSGE